MSDPETAESLARLLEIMRTLRSEEGCPWDREQTVESLRRYAVEEVYEVIDAIDRNDLEDHCEELGDLLLQVVFQAQIREEEGAFGFKEVATAISDKLVRRHPHVFGGTDVADADEVIRNWNAIKSEEKAERGRLESTSALDGIPLSLPALLYAAEIQKKAAKVGFDWEEEAEVLAKVEEEVGEVRDGYREDAPGRVDEEIGDLLFAVVNLCRHRKLDPEQSLRDATKKFMERFRSMEQAADRGNSPLDAMSAEDLDRLWEASKRSSG